MPSDYSTPDAGIKITDDAIRAFMQDQQGSYLKVRDWYIDALGDLLQAVYLSKLAYWSKYADEDGWIDRTVATIERAIGMSRRQQDTARKALVEAGLIEVERRGIPAKLHYRIVWPALIRLAARTPLRPDGFERDTYTPDGDDHTTVYESAKQDSAPAPAPTGQSGVRDNAKLDDPTPPRQKVQKRQSFTYKNKSPINQESAGSSSDQSSRPHRPRPVSGGAHPPERRPPLTIAQLHALDPVADRELIARGKIEPVPPRDAGMIEIVAWDECAQAWRKRRG